MKITYANRSEAQGLSFISLTTGYYIGAETGRLYWKCVTEGKGRLFDMELQEECTSRKSRSGRFIPSEVETIVHGPPWPK